MEKCPCCGEPLVDQPTTGTQYRQKICYGMYETGEGDKSLTQKCQYHRIEKDGKVVFENIKRGYLTRGQK